VFDGSGTRLEFGAKLGTGGEGTVYELRGRPDLVAKVYQKPLPREAEEKIRLMAVRGNKILQSIAAWPMSPVYSRSGGPIIGFLMPKLCGYSPIHKLYSPAHRKMAFPSADWRHLVNAARNAAAAFAVIHQLGHVIGDVNQGNLFVAANTSVKLIDCDSFQFQENGRVFPCEVGVAHFTPPELQKAKTFRGIRRVQNHDNFGLAVLLFHLLFMGRHPFSGVYSGRQDMPIERAIESFRFAFSTHTASRDMSPPPNSVSLSIVPEEIRSLFETAFGPSGTQASGRPTARTWVSALDKLRSSFRTCGTEQAHRFWQGLTKCPWCELEQSSGVLFFVAVVTTQATGPFDIAVIWKRISQIPPPEALLPFDPTRMHVIPKPPSQEVQTARMLSIVRKVLAGGLILGTLAIAPGAIVITGLLALVLFFIPVNDSGERRQRKAALEQAKASWQNMQAVWQREASGGLFRQAMDELRRAKEQREQLDRDYTTEKQRLLSTIKERQLQLFLGRYFIDDSDISNIGPGRKATLASFGIETAADIDRHRIMRIKGFGPSLTDNLLGWRRKIEAKFVFDSAKGIDPQDAAALQQRFDHKRRELEGILLAGPERLEKLRSEAVRSQDRLRPQVQNAAHGLAQAMADANAR
jgi:DNA-binding helix-hairpin-helix protein with protein kinase domain